MEFKGLNTRQEDDFHDVLGEIPSKIAKRTVLVFCILLLLFIIVSFIFKYPDTVDAEITITSTNPPANLVARQNGKIQYLFVKNNDKVTPGRFIAIIENPADFNDMKVLKDKIKSIDLDHWNNLDSLFFDFRPRLGDIQATYLAFNDAVHKYNVYKKIDYHEKKIRAAKLQIRTMNEYQKKIKTQLLYKTEELDLMKKNANLDSLLRKRGVLSETENEQSKIQYLQSLSNALAVSANLTNVQAQINDLEESILDLELQEEEQQNNLIADLRETLESLKNSISNWEINYTLKSPLEGKVVFTNYWSMNQNVKAGEIVFTVIPKIKNEMIGKAILTAQRAGKVKIGQKVKVKLYNYPENEFGTVEGVINNISEIPIDDNYTVEVIFPDGLKTSYKKELPSTRDLKGTAMIITEDLKLIERLIMPVRSILTESF